MKNPTPEEVERIRSMTLTIRELMVIDLMRDYRAIRKRAFGNSIPPAEAVGFCVVPEKLMTKTCCGEAFEFCYVPKDYKFSGTIGMCECNSIEETRQSLLHAMAHLKINFKFKRDMGHGKYFKAEMRRLVAVGELDDWI
jgi:hypothetical protein